MSGGGSLSPGQIITGSLFNEPMRIETVQPNGPASWAVGLVGTQSERFRKVTLTAADLDRLTVIDTGHSFDGDGRLLRLGLQAYALGIAYEFDPYFGLSISRVDPKTNNGFNYISTGTKQQDSYQLHPRLDWSISENTKLYVSYNRQRDTAVWLRRQALCVLLGQLRPVLAAIRGLEYPAAWAS